MDCMLSSEVLLVRCKGENKKTVGIYFSFICKQPLLTVVFLGGVKDADARGGIEKRVFNKIIKLSCF